MNFTTENRILKVMKKAGNGFLFWGYTNMCYFCRTSTSTSTLPQCLPKRRLLPTRGKSSLLPPTRGKSSLTLVIRSQRDCFRWTFYTNRKFTATIRDLTITEKYRW